MPDKTTAVVTLYTLAIGAIGAAIAWLFSFPVYALTGPALLVAVVSFTGIRVAISDLVRDGAFLFLGISVGAGFNAQATAAVLRWPLAFIGLLVVLLLIFVISRYVLTRFFGFDRASAVLAATPGHLSFVIGLGTALDLDVARVAVVQSVRLLSLTLIVPIAALLFGIETNANILPSGDTISGVDLVMLTGAALAVGMILQRLKVPAAIFLAGMVLSTIGHVTDITPGVLWPWITLPSFVILAIMIGSRFSGMTLMQLKQGFFAGIAVTAIAAGLALAVALPTSIVVGIPAIHVAVAFAPGGFETMIVMGAILGANPGFIAALHISRLLVLPILLPIFLGRTKSVDE